VSSSFWSITMDNMRTKVNRQPALARQVADILQKKHMALIQAIEEMDVGKARKTAQKHVINAARRYGIYISAT